jgi:hypothetical protein
MPDGEIVVTLSRTEAEELHCLLEWTNDPQFRDLSWRVMESINAAEDAAKMNGTNADEVQNPSAGSLPTTEINQS